MNSRGVLPRCELGVPVPNVMLTTACNFRCGYCFGKDMMGSCGAQFMNRGLFEHILGWVSLSGNDYIGVMGGEPTLSPIFDEVVRTLATQGFSFRIYSNVAANTLSDEIIRTAADHDARFVVNVNDPKGYTATQLASLRTNLSRLKTNAVLTFNLSPFQTNYDHVFAYIEEFGLKPSIKVGIALPTLSFSNDHVKLSQLENVTPLLRRLIQDCRRRSVRLGFECGVPSCILPEAERRALEDEMDLDSINDCGNLLDISPVGEVFNCLPLYSWGSKSYSEFEDYAAARRYFKNRLKPLSIFGKGNECPVCPERLAAKCTGGCMVRSLQGVRTSARQGDGNA
jgi:MoaA/NifB/PqqE/SkfB family radical SAM enzyme